MRKLETGDTVHIAGENKTGYVVSTLPKGLVIVKFVDKTMKRYKISDLEKVKEFKNGGEAESCSCSYEIGNL